ncbi:MAG TPA: hypothetical protein DGG95_01050 [Cytophagales bacterium]|jgi:hypothetical protein|nr:hypothetical protein [Cytophagales bacterium]
MNKNLIWFSISLLTVLLIIAVGFYQFRTPSFLNLILISLGSTTWLVYLFMANSKTENFIRNYLLTIVIKLLAGGIFIFALIYIDPSSADENSILFLLTYVLLTFLEVGFLFKKFSAS